MGIIITALDTSKAKPKKKKNLITLYTAVQWPEGTGKQLDQFWPKINE